jgi:ubiquinone/menaquinone biosynthesis C-methylase UbiE
MKDNFSLQATEYAKYRPRYPAELFEFVIKHVQEKEMALDCGTGNGQAAAALSEFFSIVHATDISESQLKQAVKKANIHYLVSPAEELPFDDSSFDLMVAATAVHWFDLETFFTEIKRIGKNNSVFACWAYKVFHSDRAVLNEMIQEFYFNKIHSYWDPERKYVDEEYQSIPFPFREIPNPGFVTKLTWNMQELEGYLNTWSAVQHYIRKHDENPVTEFMKKLRTVFDRDILFNLSFPIFMRVGIIEK